MTHALEDYLYWQASDKQKLKRINALLKKIQRDPFNGTGKPEALKEKLSGWWSRRINQQHRLVYRVTDSDIEIVQCRRHY